MNGKVLPGLENSTITVKYFTMNGFTFAIVRKYLDADPITILTVDKPGERMYSVDEYGMVFPANTSY